jgi:hypothetical protein
MAMSISSDGERPRQVETADIRLRLAQFQALSARRMSVIAAYCSSVSSRSRMTRASSVW